MPKLPVDRASACRRGYTLGEEIANSVTHGVGAILSVAALAVLVVSASMRGSARHVAAYSVFGVSMIVLYTMSTLYHSMRNPRVKRVFEILDHSSIYILIAGTYTAFTLTALPPAVGLRIFGAVWALALTGIVLKTVWFDRARLLSVPGYLAMGWLIAPAAGHLRTSLSTASLVLLAAGGLAYTAGIAFYAVKKVKWFHPVWHIFVLAGSALHVLAALAALPEA